MHDIRTGLTWTGLVYGVVFFGMLLGLFLMWVWPRDQEGKRMSVEEVTEFMDKFPSPPKGSGGKIGLALVAIAATIGLALSKTNINHHDHHHDD